MIKNSEFFSQLKPCDLFFYRAKGFIGKCIGFFSLSKYAHVACYIGTVNGIHTIIESHLQAGVVEKEFNVKYIPEVDVWRHKKTINTDKVIKSLRRYIGRKYDLGAFPATFFRSTIGLVLNAKWLRVGVPILNNKDTFFCSELQAIAWEDSGFKIVNRVNAYNASPEDLVRDKELVKVLEGRNIKC